MTTNFKYNVCNILVIYATYTQYMLGKEYSVFISCVCSGLKKMYNCFNSTSLKTFKD